MVETYNILIDEKLLFLIALITSSLGVSQLEFLAIISICTFEAQIYIRQLNGIKIN